MKIIFAGTPEFAAVQLQALMRSSHELLAIYTQPDKPAGRGLKLTASPVKMLAQQTTLPLHQPTTLKSESEQKILADYHADVMVVAAYGMLLPAAVLAIPRHGCINVHPSLLPRWRGAAPIQRTIYAGDKITGVTIMQMDVGLDTGPILLQHQYALALDETSQSLHDVLARMGGESLVATLDLLAENNLTITPQDNTLSTYASKISKQEALIDWEKPAQTLEQEIRAFNPWPISYTTWCGENLRIWHAKALATSSHVKPRTIVKVASQGIDVAAGNGVLRILAAQLPGGKVLSAADFYNAKRAHLIEGQAFV